MCIVLAKLQESATLATDWYDSNLLQGNLKIYQMMSIRNKNVTCGDKMCIENLKLLGVTIDCGLNFDGAILFSDGIETGRDWIKEVREGLLSTRGVT